ncbi:FMN-binding protein MioC [Aliiglaciecola litoralis]|uniref:FMN-binding protein MioC n=1 Tax=Aliiglaciecola litoralis TaxID=582857 RepID=A0ABP3X4P2_9ALTE
MASYDILVGTVLGASEYVADALSETLSEQGHSVSIHLDPNVQEINPDAIWLICSSTHGAGDLPDNIQPFAKQISGMDLSHITFLVVGLGDSSYDTYCNGAMVLQNLMEKAGAKLAYQPIHIDVLHHPIPEDIAVEWLKDYLQNAV